MGWLAAIKMIFSIILTVAPEVKLLLQLTMKNNRQTTEMDRSAPRNKDTTLSKVLAFKLFRLRLPQAL